MNRVTFIPQAQTFSDASSREILIDGKHVGTALISTRGAEETIRMSLTEHGGLDSGLERVVAAALYEDAFTRVSAARVDTIPADQSSTPAVLQKEWAGRQPLSITDFDRDHAAGVSSLCRAEGWTTYADPAVARQGCAAPGVTTLTAVHELLGTVAGFAQVLSDGIAQGYLAQLIIHPSYRGIGLGRTLVTASHRASGAARLDLLTDDAQGFYETFPGHPKHGYRIYPDQSR